MFESEEELKNFEKIAAYVMPSPGDIPNLSGVDIYGESMPLNGILGGDHLIWLDFKVRYDLEARIDKAFKRGRKDIVDKLNQCKTKAGIVVADVAGHRITDALLALMLHQAFLLGTHYELDMNGEISTRLFENLNTRFYKSSSVSKFLTMVYGEISENGNFRFLSAAHPLPVVFSRCYDKIVDIGPETFITFPPIGTVPSSDDIDRRRTSTVLGFKDKYEVNEISLMGAGDILISYTDGLGEHSRNGVDYFPEQLEDVLRKVKDLSARQIFQAIKEDLLAFGDPHDDITYIVIKRL